MRFYFKADAILVTPDTQCYKLDNGNEYPLTISGMYTVIPDPNYGVFVNLMGQEVLDDQGKESDGTFRMLCPFQISLMLNERATIGVPYSSLVCTVYRE